jgi:hypothetical protein
MGICQFAQQVSETIHDSHHIRQSFRLDHNCLVVTYVKHISGLSLEK